ncbi:unnamed protein product [Peniophora sp. CBMAI 1063]|nr:unnamed protein product [Peniophora sp. CBMAI 1063]
MVVPVPTTPSGPSPPAAPDEATIDSFLASHPLFMTSLPDAESEDPTLAALQSLAYDGTPDEIASNFKSQGNEYFKGKRFREAAGFYTQALDAQPSDKSLLEALLLNRAACNLELQNYGRVLHDTAHTLTLNPTNSKAYYRSAQALYALDRLPEALDAATRCLTFDPSNAAMESIRAKVQKRIADKEARERERRARAAEEEKLNAALRERNIYPEKLEEGRSISHDYRVRWDDEDPDSLIIPVFFLYPQHAITDAIPSFAEHTPFTLHLQSMFPPSAPPPAWDEKGEYTADGLVVYAVTRRKRVLKVGRRMSLADVCRSAGGSGKEGEGEDGLEMRDGGLAFAVLPRGEEEARWVAQVKKERGF